MPDTSPHLGPYAHAAASYWAAGWRGILPIPAGAKWPPPAGWTGADADWPSYPDVHAWTEARPASNIALRLPRNVIGLDIDAYDGKNGHATLAAAEAQHGTLPATWRTGSRADGVSGIRLYRVPEGLAWPGELGPGVEIIQTRHRYAVVWPSVHPNGSTYRWTDPAGVVSATAVPAPDELPALPQAWIDALTRGQLEQRHPRAGLGDNAAWTWLAEHGAGEPCRAVTAYLAAADAGLRASGGSRHDAALHATRRLAQLAADGHTGVTPALGHLHRTWQAVAEADTTRTSDPAEWGRMLLGAIDQAAASPPAIADPCDEPFAGIIAPLADLGTHAATGPAHVDAFAATTASPPAADGERSSWQPRDLTDAIAGVNQQPPPAHLTRDDGNALLYTGRINGILGESESGKTWIALHAVTQALADGIPVTYLDFEDNAPGVVSRLQALSATNDQLSNLFAYLDPDTPLDANSNQLLHQHLAEHCPGLVVIDGVNAAMTLLGLDLMSNTDATKFAQVILKPIADTGAAVLYIDHVPKSKDNESKGGIGAQAKRAMTTGAALRAEVLLPFGRGVAGKVKLTVDKDRPGHVRGISTGSRTAGTVTITPAGDDRLTIAIEAPDTRPADEREPFRPTRLMEKVCGYLAGIPDGATQRQIERDVQGKSLALREAVSRLVEEGYVKRTPGPRNSTLHTLLKRYCELDELVSDEGDDEPEASASPVRPSASWTQCETPSRVRPVTASSPRRGDAGRTQGSVGPEPPTPTASRDALEPTSKRAWMNGRLIDLATGEVIEDRP